MQAKGPIYIHSTPVYIHAVIRHRGPQWGQWGGTPPPEGWGRAPPARCARAGDTRACQYTACAVYVVRRTTYMRDPAYIQRGYRGVPWGHLRGVPWRGTRAPSGGPSRYIYTVSTSIYMYCIRVGYLLVYGTDAAAMLMMMHSWHPSDRESQVSP